MSNKHCWHVEGYGTSTLMTFGNHHTAVYRCCYCGTKRIRKSQDVMHQMMHQIKGHGPHAQHEVEVFEPDTDECEAPHD